MKIPPHFKPAIGGLAVGLIALWRPEVLSMGYGWLQLGINHDTARLAVGTMAALVALKILTTSLTIGSGGSGGVFAPGLFIGGMLGGAMWGVLYGRAGWLPATPAPFVIVGMMAMFGGVAKAPIAVMLMVAEMTGEFSMIVPAMIATSIAYLIAGDVSIYENQVATRGDSPAHRGEFTIPLLQSLTVGEAMRTAVVTVAPEQNIEEAERRMSEHGIRGMPVTDQGRLVGMFTASDALRAKINGVLTVRGVMATDLVVAHTGESLLIALQKMTRAVVSRLPVVERDASHKVVGILGMRDVASILDLEVNDLSRIRARSTSPSDDPLRSILVANAMNRRFEVVPSQASIRQAAELMASSGVHALLVGHDGALHGILTASDLERAAAEDPDLAVGQIAQRDVVVAHPGQTVAEALGQSGAESLRQLPVVQRHNGQLVPVGLLSRSDVVAAYVRARDRQSRSARLPGAAGSHDRTGVATVDVVVADQSRLAGKTLMDLALPSDSVITSIKRNGTTFIPRGLTRLEPGDRLELLVADERRAAVLALLGDDDLLFERPQPATVTGPEP